ncbi:MAG: hypothetical protein EOP00_19535 [Pedobacter sp.]|nr:MAG: hypothetical protein EOP00_19535 [Pedobacter sp.]
MAPSRERYIPIKMTLHKLCGLTFLFFICFACNHTSNQSNSIEAIDTAKVDTTKTVNINSTIPADGADSSIINENLEDEIIDSIFSLTEVKERAKYIEEQTRGKRHLKIWVADIPNTFDHKYYWIKVGEDNGTNLVTHFNFYVYLDPLRIMYYDTQNDNELTLNKWRKINGM